MTTPLGSLVGLPVDQTEQALDRSGFRAVRRPGANDEYPPGYVVGQAPEAGTDQPGGSAVTLDVSDP